MSDIGSIDVEEYPGLIKSMPVEYKITVPTSGDDAEVLLYPYSTDPLDGQDFGKLSNNYNFEWNQYLMALNIY